MGRLAQKLKAEQAREIVAMLADLWPYCFSVFEHRRQLLKHGIHVDVLAVAKGAITDGELKIALRFYCGGFGYLRNCIAGAARVDLDGELAGKVTADEAAFAAARIADIKSRLRAKPYSGNDKLGSDKRVSFADLRAAALARKAVAS